MSTRAVLLDIGTVCSISFVRDTLFPYALRALPSYLSENWDSEAFQPYRHAFPEGVRDDKEKLEQYVRDLTEQDKKEACLKQLQGLLWRTGYESGDIKAPIYDDVKPAMEKWKEEGKKVVIYSSGSVAAQKLLFAHTVHGDFLPLLDGYYDTVNAGLKTQPESYAKIADAEGVEKGEWLFFSDNVKEVEAAKAAGMDAIVVVRPGNAPLTSEDRETHKVVENFEGL